MRARFLVASLALAVATTGGVERKAATINNQANVLFDKQKFEDASKLYGEAQTRAPESPEISYNLGNALYRQGHKQEALPLLQRGAQSQDPALRQRSLYNLGNAFHDTGKLPEAASAYRQSLAIDPADRDAKINYEKTMRELDQQKKQPQQQQGNGQQKQDDKNQNQNQQSQSGQGNSQQDQQQQGQNDPKKGDDQSQQQQDEKGQEGEPKEPKDAQGDPQDQQHNAQDQQSLAGFDSVAAGDLSKEEAMRILEAMRQQETELQKARAKQQKARSRRVDKDW